MSGAEAEIAIGLVVAAFSIIGGGLFRRLELQRADERKEREKQRQDTGRRIGRLERYVDFQRGLQAGVRQTQRKRGTVDR